jgi:hypothetical protein
MGCALVLASAHAQAPDALGAANPAHPVQPAPWVLPPGASADTPALPADLAAARAIWQRVNQRVAEFPRGHADLLRWEAGTPEAATAPAAPALTWREALRLSLRHRPELFTHADMNPLTLAQVKVAYATHVRELQRAWIDATAARQRERLLAELLDATRTGSELGRRMVVAGNWSQARQAREQLIEANAWQALVDARSASQAAQEHLARLLGIWEAQAVAQLGERLPQQLPALPEQASPGTGLTPATLEAAVLRSHPTLAQSRLLTQRDMSAIAPSQLDAWNAAVNAALDAQPNATRADSEPPHIDNLSLLRDGSLERAVHAQAALLALAAERRAMARQAWAALQSRHALALHAQNVVVPLQTTLAQETQLRYNGMLQSTWELLASARERLGALDAALQAQRSYWLAQADWQALLAGAGHAAADNAASVTTAAPTAGH